MGRVLAGRRNRPWHIASAFTEVTAGQDALLPEERAVVEGASAERLAEFATGRQCARLALASLPGSGTTATAPDAVPVLRDERGAPLWPGGVVGSITHCPGWTGAVVARSSGAGLGVGGPGVGGSGLGRPGLGRPGVGIRRRGRDRGLRGLGLDAEPLAALPDGVLDVVASAGERARVERLRGEQPGIPWDTVLFVAKEATYKAWYPLTGILLAHGSVHVELSASGRFTGVATAPDEAGCAAVHRVRGRWRVGPRVVVALGVVP